METVCWGMIGCGAVAEKKSAPGLYKSQYSTLRGVYSTTAARAQDFARRHKVPVVYQTVEEMLADPLINAVYLATPPKFHKQYALQCMRAGKIPYIEKPMANNYQDCQEILELSKQTGIPVYVAYYRRGLEKYIRIKELVDSGVLGNIRFVQLSQFMCPEAADLDKNNLPWRLQPQATGGGKFMDMATHVLDIVEYFFGEITSVHGQAENYAGLYEVEDTVSAIFRCKSGVMGNGMWCYAASFNHEEMLIVGEKGHIRTTGLFYAPVEVVVDGKAEVLDFPEPEHVAQPYIQLLVNEMTGRGKAPADAQSAANVARVIDEILQDYRKRY
ncbi:Gfo/Idh/MocA family oxidoreductase [Ruminococcaceae bacterium OttesenSCG-928-A16]|nr:Gfo/Idh/MocA family oxidoreductase [Ruminococcaceae bacterium OttesenSCG-928-A16]